MRRRMGVFRANLDKLAVLRTVGVLNESEMRCHAGLADDEDEREHGRGPSTVSETRIGARQEHVRRRLMPTHRSRKPLAPQSPSGERRHQLEAHMTGWAGNQEIRKELRSARSRSPARMG